MALWAAAFDEDAMLGGTWGRLSACAGRVGPQLPVSLCVFNGARNGFFHSPVRERHRRILKTLDTKVSEIGSFAPRSQRRLTR
jgi:hypothetical protein